MRHHKPDHPSAPAASTRGVYSYAHGGLSLKEYLTPVLVVSGRASNAPAAAITEISWKGLRCNLEVSGAAVLAVLISPEGRVIAQRRSVVGGEA